jgi:hypothetical protein
MVCLLRRSDMEWWQGMIIGVGFIVMLKVMMGEDD